MTQKYNIQAAYEFYRKFIYNKEHQALLTENNFHIAGSFTRLTGSFLAPFSLETKAKMVMAPI